MSNDPAADHELGQILRPQCSLRGGLIGAMVVAKTADGLVTVVALTAAAGTERNPVPATVFETVGIVPGIVGLTVLSLLVAVGGIEWAAMRAPGEQPTPTLVRLVGYGSLAGLWSLLTLSNLLIVG